MCRLKILVPIGVIGFAALVPVNLTDHYLDEFVFITSDNSTSIANTTSYTSVDRLSLANISNNSHRYTTVTVSTFQCPYIKADN